MSMLRVAEGFVSCPLARCHGYGVAPSHARQRSSSACCNHPGLLLVLLFFFKLDRTFFKISFPWKQNSTDQILNDDNPKQRLIHHEGFKKKAF